MLSLNQLNRYYDKAKQELEDFRPMMREIYTLCMPSKNNWHNTYITNRMLGVRNDIELYNSFAVTATKQFAANMVSFIAPTGSKFFKIKDLEIESITNPDVKKQQAEQFESEISPVSDAILDHLTSSNFYQAVNEAFVDLAAGTGGLLINYDPLEKEIIYKSLDMSMVSFLEDNLGRISYVFRQIGMLDKDDQVRLYPDVIFKSDTIELIECVYYDAQEKHYQYYLTDSGFGDIYLQSISQTNPFVIFRWSKMSFETRGRGILNDQLANIKTANLMAKNILAAAAKIIDPPYKTTSNSLVNPYNLRIQPGGLVVLKDQTSMFEPLQLGGNLPFGVQQVEQVNNDLSSAMFINTLGEVGSAQLTATEVTARLQQVSRIIGASYNRLQREFLSPMFDRTIELLESFQVITPVTIDLKQNRKRNVIYRFESPLVDIQKQVDAQKLLQAIQFTAAVTGNQAQVYINSAFDVISIPRYVSEAVGAPLDLVHTSADTKAALTKIVNAAAQMQAQANPALGTQPLSTGLPGIQ